MTACWRRRQLTRRNARRRAAFLLCDSVDRRRRLLERLAIREVHFSPGDVIVERRCACGHFESSHGPSALRAWLDRECSRCDCRDFQPERVSA